MAGPTLLEKVPGLMDRICELARQGKTDEEIAKIIGISHRTLCRWKVDDIVFASYLKENKDLADEMVVQAAHKNAIGFEYEEECATKDGVQSLKKYHPPNPTSQIFWLKNRRPGEWKDRVEHNVHMNEVDEIEDDQGGNTKL